MDAAVDCRLNIYLTLAIFHIYVVHQQDHLLLSQLCQKARTGLIRRSAIIELHPQNWTWPHFGA